MGVKKIIIIATFIYESLSPAQPLQNTFSVFSVTKCFSVAKHFLSGAAQDTGHGVPFLQHRRLEWLRPCPSPATQCKVGPSHS